MPNERGAVRREHLVRLVRGLDSGSGVEILGDYAGAPANTVPAAADLTHIIIADLRISGKGTVTDGPDQPGMIAGTQMSKILSIVGSSWTLVTGLP